MELSENLSSLLIKKLDIPATPCYLYIMAGLSKKITEQTQNMPEDIAFGYRELAISAQDYQSAAKVLERLQKKGVIKKLSKGRFYKPKMTPFGEIRPDEQQILKPYLYQNGKRIAYITGSSLYNKLGLTTQVAARLQIASRDKRIFINRGNVQATPVKSYVDVTDDNYQMLGLLDAMKDLKEIPDVNVKSAIMIFKNRIEALDKKQRDALISYALQYPPRVRALLGALLTTLNKKRETKTLKDSLNPITVFKLGLNDKLLPSASEWNIQ